MIALGGLITCFPALAPATTPVLAVLAVAGFVAAFLTGPRGPIRSLALQPGARGGLVAAGLSALLVFLVYGAPVIFSGEPGFAGYIKLDDTSTWLAFTDHVLAHGHSVAGLAPSSYEATVQINLQAGYPLGAFIPLAVGSELGGIDPAWTFQPYLALMAALMALVFYELARPVIARPSWRAGAAFFAAQAPLLVGYAWWGGIKEIATALVAAVFAAGLARLVPAPGPVADPGSPAAPEATALQATGNEADPLGALPARGVGTAGLIRGYAPLPVLAGAALVGVMGAGGAPWVAGLLAGWVVLAGLRLRSLSKPAGGGAPVRRLLAAGGTVLGGVAVVGLPTVFASGQLFSPTQGPLTSGEEMGNLIAPLKLAQYAGPWPVGDFRLVPDATAVTVILVAATLIAAGFGVHGGLRRRAGGLLLTAGGIGAGSLVVWAVGSPWVQGKALATGTAAFLLLATVGIAVLLAGAGSGHEAGRSPANPGVRSKLRVAGALLLIVPAGVVVSNALAYTHSWLAPHGQLAELETIGETFPGQGPGLMTEYQPYGVRHFLRDLDAEGASELRRRQVPRLDGATADKGAWSDTDELVLDPAREGLFTYRTLVLRRNPDQSRPPSLYRRVWQGRYYEVWQRPADFDPASVALHQPLGGDHQPAAVPACSLVRSTAAQAGPDGRVAAVERPPNGVADLTEHPSDWVPDPESKTLTPLSDGTATGRIQVPEDGRYRVWVGGSARGKVEVRVGGIAAGSARGLLNNNGQFIELDQIDLATGEQTVTITYERGGALRPATRDYPFGLGPVVIEPVAEPKLVELPSAEARQLCGRSLDWIEAIR